MRIISRTKLKKFWENQKFKDAEFPLRAWFFEAKNANLRMQFF